VIWGYEKNRGKELRHCRYDSISGILTSTNEISTSTAKLSKKKLHSFGLLYIQNSINAMMHTIEFWIPSKLEEIILCIEKYN
jgi:hypothetical protein